MITNNPKVRSFSAYALAAYVVSSALFGAGAWAAADVVMLDPDTSAGAAHTESYKVSSGGVDVNFDLTYDANGAVLTETRTWMLLPDEDGYRAYVTERKEGAGDFVETGRGAIYDPDADGVADAGAPGVPPAQRSAALSASGE